MPSDSTPLLPAPDAPLLLPAPPGARPASGSGGRRHVKWIVAGGLSALLAVAFAFGWFVHHRSNAAAAAANERRRTAIPIVTVVAARRSANLSELLLPGSLTPITEASLYARASGYLKRRHVDIGDPVRRGQLLAEIDSPELDQQVEQGLAGVAQARQQLGVARAAVGDARARLDLARVTWQRYETLLQQDSVARQEVDQHRQEYESAQATLVSAEASVGAAVEAVRAGEANRRRLVALQQFEKVTAPFDGIITARNVSEGALIGSGGASIGDASMASTGANASTSGPTSGASTTGGAGSVTSTAGSSSGGGGSAAGAGPTELFRIAQIDRLRVYVSVPQDSAARVQIGSPAAIFLQEFSGHVEGRVTRTAGALDNSSRTLLTEVQIDNAEHTLMPGAYAQVRLASARSNPPLLVPGEALITRAESTSVASLRPLDEAERRKLHDPADARCARRIHLQRVAIGRDYGTEVEISQGLRGDEFLVLNPGDTVQENAVMLPQLQKTEESSGQGGGAAQKPNDGGKKDKDEDKDAEQDRERAQAQRTCVEDEAAARQRARPPGADPASRPAPGGTSAGPPDPGAAAAASGPGGPSDRAPAGIQSPSIVAPTQGRPKSSAGGNGGSTQGQGK